MKRITTLVAALLIGATGAAFAQKQEAPKAAPAPAVKAAPAPAAAPAAKAEPMDINSATDKELASLPKIGDAKAAAIIKGRPWGGKDDLVKKKILSKAEYDAIKELIVAKQAPKEAAKKDEKKK
ncbi:MAG: helix-hairpin-helix domain-containing protein [Usitatibacteraceae bacterium]